MSGSSVSVVGFGCRLNMDESGLVEHLARGTPGDRPLVVINSCAVTGEAVRQARQAARRARREQPEARIVVTGCAAQTEPGTFATMAEVDHVLGNREKRDAALWRQPAAWPRVAVSDIMAAGALPAPPPRPRGRQTRATLQVQNGCDHRCTFCVIPFGRGNARSLPPEEAVAAARRLVGQGYREIVLTGVDLTAYGEDLPGRPRLGRLVRQLLDAVPDLPRLRLSSIDSVEVDEDLLACLAGEPRLMPYLHLSLQAGDDMILKRMKRRHTREQAIAFCALARRLRPDVVFGADIIAGFPTEDEAMFANSCAMVEACGITHLHVFPYSARPGTPAARMPQLAGPVIAARARRLREIGAEALAAHAARQVGRRHKVLVEHGDRGHTEGLALVRLKPGRPAGEIAEVLVGGSDGRQLLEAA